MIWNIFLQGNLPGTYFPTSWLRQNVWTFAQLLKQLPQKLRKCTHATCKAFSFLLRGAEGWVLVSEPGFLGFGPFPRKSNSFTRNEGQEQHSLLDTIFNYILYFGPPGKHLKKTRKRTTCRPAVLPTYTIVGLGDLNIDVFLEAQT